MRRDWILIALIAAAALALRIYPAWTGLFTSQGVNFHEPDSWYHVRLIEHQVHNFPWRATLDPYAAPGGQFVPVAPLFDTLVSTLVEVVHGRDATTQQIETLAAFVPPILGAFSVIAVWALGRRVFGPVAGLLAAALLAVLPGHFMDRTMLGFLDHHALEAFLALTTLLALAFALPPRSAVPWVTSDPISRPLTPAKKEENATPSMMLPPSDGSSSDHLAAQATLSWEQASKTGVRGRFSGSEVGNRGQRSTGSRSTGLAGAVVGVVLGLYLLAWSSGAFLLAILGVWLLLLIPLRPPGDDLPRASRVMSIAALVALALVLIFQHPRMYRYGSQVIGLVGLFGIALALRFLEGRHFGPRPRVIVLAIAAALTATAAAVAWIVNPALVWQVITDAARLIPGRSRVGVLEARPLFLYQGEWVWLQPWLFFRTGFYVGVAALLLLGGRITHQRRAVDLLLWTFAGVTLLATLGQNRFGYYLVPACALLGGWLLARVLEWGGVTRSDDSRIDFTATPTPWLRQAAAIAIVAAIFAPNLQPRLLLAPRTGLLAEYWQDAMIWLRDNTPPPFLQAAGAGDEYYVARYPDEVVPPPDHVIMNWWDMGYWIIQRARRVPVANPTQVRATVSSRFYAETDEVKALRMLRDERVRFVLSDWELPFRRAPEGNIMGRFQSVLDWADGAHAKYYEVYYRRKAGAWEPVWIFHEPYYRSMAYRLAVLGGTSAVPVNSTSLLTVAERTENTGRRFREIVSEQTYPSYGAARVVAATIAAKGSVIVGLDPWRSAFPLEALTSVKEVHSIRTTAQKATEAPFVRVFEVREPALARTTK